MEQNPSISSKAERKTIEKNRRNHMKSLFSKLTSLVPHHSREVLSLPDQLEEATNYIKKLQIGLEKMKERRLSLVGSTRLSIRSDAKGSLRLPQIEIHVTGSVLEVVLITGLDYQFIFTKTTRVLLEEGAEVVNANFSVLHNSVFHSIHSKIGESEPHCVAARVSERLKKIVYGDQ